MKRIRLVNLGGFGSTDTGPIGIVYGQDVSYYYDTRQKEILKLEDKLDPQVYLYRMGIDFPTDLLEFVLESGAKGLVLEGFGVGAITPDSQDLVQQIIQKGIPVVLTTRCLTGGVRPVYDTKGAGKQLEDIGVIFESEISGTKARLKLIAMLASDSKDDIKANWNKY